MLTLALLLVVFQPPEPAELPLVTVTADNTVLSAPCRVRIAPGAVIADPDNNGVIQIAFDEGEVGFEPESVLRGSAKDAAADSYTGIGIRVENHKGVTITGARLEGFKVALLATAADDLTLADCHFKDNWRQRLRSTAQAEDQSDWLWPHVNDQAEWRQAYGASACIERSSNVTIRECTARSAQNGLILDRVNNSRVYDNDFSFLSGWGLALWRSSDNLISRNALDFCIRGYSHGVYNRGQDSAGILMFEQCWHNTIVENSATHCGDGFFAFAGKEALGEVPPGHARFQYERQGCKENFVAANDFSYAAAHGLELTFSFGNRIHKNRLAGNAICGIWAGYSQETVIDENTIEDNGLSGSREGGGINIEHGRANVIARNRLARNTVGVSLWWDEDGALMQTPWAKANGAASADNRIEFNTFTGDTAAIRLRKTERTGVTGNKYQDIATEIDADAESPQKTSQIVGSAFPSSNVAPVGDKRPVGARPKLAGRQHIIMTPWGPWDHASPLIRLASDDGFQHGYDVYKLPDGELTISVESGQSNVEAVARLVAADDPRSLALSAVSTTPGVHPYALRVQVGPFNERVSGTLINCLWDATFFASPHDPRKELDAWRAESRGDKAVKVELNQLKLPFGMAGPSQLKLPDLPQELKGADLPRDHFGTIASTVIPLPPGKWRISTLSDDGVRVTISTGSLTDGPGGQPKSTTVIDNWTHHGPTRDEGTFEIPANPALPSLPVPVRIDVEHFELDGYAVLELELSPVPAPPAPTPVSP